MHYRERDRLRKQNIETIETELMMNEPEFCQSLAAKMNKKHIDQVEYAAALFNRAIDVAVQKFDTTEGNQHLADYLIHLSRSVREDSEQVFSLAYHYENYLSSRKANRVIAVGGNSVEVEL